MAAPAVEEARARLGRVGIWLNTMKLAATPVDLERRELARIEALGYRSVWFGEGIGGKEAFAHLGLLLASSERLVIGTGIANLWARHPAAMQGGAATLADAYPGRVALGVGVSTPMLVQHFGMAFDRPVERMTAYLDGMDQSAVMAPTPAVPFPRLLGALGPTMLGLARDRADGSHPYFVPLAHTQEARGILGPDKLLVPELAVVLEQDATAARAAGRDQIGQGLRLPGSAYVRNLRRLGYDDDDLADGGSDRLVDDVVAWGNDDAIAAQVGAHLEAGADTVLVQPLGVDLPAIVDQLERLAPALLAL